MVRPAHVVLQSLLLLSAATLLAGPPEVPDAAGDSAFVPGHPPPDLRAASVVVTRKALVLRARFAPGAFERRNTFVQFSLGASQAAVGEHGCPQCGSYLVEINGIGTRPGRAEVRRLESDSKYHAVADVAIRVDGDTIEGTVPRRLLLMDLGNVTYRVVACTRLGDDAVSAILDALPDDGVAQAMPASR